jgi:SAM-dependent methyltransferase
VKCRHCGAPLDLVFVDLGSAPPSNALLTTEALDLPEKWFPLKVMVCTGCWLVQTLDYPDRGELFSDDYVYFSSYSVTWLRHAKSYVEMAAGRFNLDSTSFVVEVAANDGYLLQYVKELGIPCLGIEPTASTANAARAKGLEIIEEFMGHGLATRMVESGYEADLVIGNNVLAHVPEINDFVAGVSSLLKPDGVVTFEFPHLLQLVRHNQFDTVYHEHFSYLSLIAVESMLARAGLTIFDVEELPTHGGSLRVFAQRIKTGIHRIEDSVGQLLAVERAAGMDTHEYYVGCQTAANRIKNDLLAFLVGAVNDGKSVAAYGAAAKGNTLMNFAGVRLDLVRFVVDRNPWKQGRFMPGSRIPIVDERRLIEEQPDYVLVLPWNLKGEIASEISYIRRWGGRLVTAVPRLQIL